MILGKAAFFIYYYAIYIWFFIGALIVVVLAFRDIIHLFVKKGTRKNG